MIPFSDIQQDTTQHKIGVTRDSAGVISDTGKVVIAQPKDSVKHRSDFYPSDNYSRLHRYNIGLRP